MVFFTLILTYNKTANSFMLYCKDSASHIKKQSGDNSKLLSQMWDDKHILHNLSNNPYI